MWGLAQRRRRRGFQAATNPTDIAPSISSIAFSGAVQAATADVGSAPAFRRCPAWWCGCMGCIGSIVVALHLYLASHVNSPLLVARLLIGMYFELFPHRAEYPLREIARGMWGRTSEPGLRPNHQHIGAPLRDIIESSGRCQSEPRLWHDKHTIGETSSVAAMFRCLPNIFFIGASKCGTSSMRSHLMAHPTIRFVTRMQSQAEGAEIHRFDRPDYGTRRRFKWTTPTDCDSL